MTPPRRQSGRLLEKFRATTDERLRRIRATVTELFERDDPEARAVVVRDLHTLKGEAKLLGFDPISRLAHFLEELWEHAAASVLSPRTPALVALLAGCDLVHEVLTFDPDDEATRTSVDAFIAPRRALIEGDEAPTGEGGDNSPPGASPSSASPSRASPSRASPSTVSHGGSSRSGASAPDTKRGEAATDGDTQDEALAAESAPAPSPEEPPSSRTAAPATGPTSGGVRRRMTAIRVDVEQLEDVARAAEEIRLSHSGRAVVRRPRQGLPAKRAPSPRPARRSRASSSRRSGSRPPRAECSATPSLPSPRVAERERA